MSGQIVGNSSAQNTDHRISKNQPRPIAVDVRLAPANRQTNTKIATNDSNIPNSRMVFSMFINSRQFVKFA
ncbi:MAG TPA: hypothetical protein DCY13_03690 [Verrucomicrobiales bacterium]|nr:hypothetical protein [Verrucomicrobiales bacterium]